LSEGGGTSNRSRRSAAPDPPPGFLVCPPDYFDTDFLFNPFMTYREKVRPRRARTQWRRLVRALEQAGAAVE
jgi:N-dimethylarginine dimethylaminohydrolase